MIIAKRKPSVVQEKAVENQPDNGFDGTTNGPDLIEDAELCEINPMTEIYNTVAGILRDIKVDPSDPDSPPLFLTIKQNQGQLTRIKNDKHNLESALSFPAAFIHLINIRWLVQTSRIGEGRADLRICFVLNRLNVGDDEYQTEGYEVFRQIHNAIEANKSNLASFTERFQLTYFDQVENFDDGLQQYWITYEIWFKDYSAYRYKHYVERAIVVPPFTNHSDQLPENNQDGHEDHEEPTIDEAAQFDTNL